MSNHHPDNGTHFKAVSTLKATRRGLSNLRAYHFAVATLHNRAGQPCTCGNADPDFTARLGAGCGTDADSEPMITPMFARIFPVPIGVFSPRQ